MSAYVKTAAPHITSSSSVAKSYWTLCMIVLPLLCLATLVFGWSSLRLIIASVLGAWIGETVVTLLSSRRWINYWNGNALYIAFIFALTLPPELSSWSAGIAIFTAILLARELLGGLGQNFLNVALFGRLLVFLFFDSGDLLQPEARTGGAILRLFIDLRDQYLGFLPAEVIALIGIWGESLVEISGLIIILCGCLLISQRIISWDIPICFFIGIAIIALIKGETVLEVILLPGTIFAGFFLLADPVTTPCSKKALRIFALGTAVGIGFLHSKMLYFEAAALSILTMNLITPWLDHFLRPTPKRYFKR